MSFISFCCTKCSNALGNLDKTKRSYRTL